MAGAIDEIARVAAGNGVFDRAMYDQVRVTADGRSEVRVFRERKTEVADVGRLIQRLLLRADDERFDERRIGPAPDLRRDFLQVARLQGLGQLHADAERRER